MDYKFLLDIALILISTKLLGLLTKKLHMPAVVGALLAGLILGPALLGILHETEFLKQLAELGVIVLMFTAGLETDMKELKKTGKASFIIALFGVIVPLVVGTIIAHLFNEGDTSLSTSTFLQNVFIGVILTATSVSISVETLKELGKLNTKAGNAILGAALIDDILGIIALTIITSMADTSVNIAIVLLKILLFFVVCGVAGFIFYKLFTLWISKRNKDLRRFVIVAFVFCLVLSFVAEHFFGVADITGAFIAGLIISSTKKSTYIATKFDTLSYIFLSPIFFASVGLQVTLGKMSSSIIIFSVLIVIFAVLTKIIGCGVGAKLCHFTNDESLQVGVGMISRGEVALIVANKGAAIGLMGSVFFGPIVIMIVFTTVITPILLKIVFTSQKKAVSESENIHTDLIDNYNKIEELEVEEQEFAEKLSEDDK